MKKPLVAVLLSGCGMYDGTEIHEAVLTLFNIDKEGGEYICIAPNVYQPTVVNHFTQKKTSEKRNMLVESSRIARGKIKDIKTISASDFDALLIPGGTGAAQNLANWTMNGQEGIILPDVKRIILECVSTGKPIAAFCMGPYVIAKALENTPFKPKLTVGHAEKSSPYDINGISRAMEKLGAIVEMTTVNDITVDEVNKIISVPCYLMEGTIYEINFGISKAIKRLFRFIP
jgi:enhancing lycopene biosynthesis protein 2